MWNNEQAGKEGWCISDSSGSENGPWQLQRVDEYEKFPSDDEAWLYVHGKAAKGSKYHQSALDYLKTANLKEYVAIQKFCGGA